MNGNSNNGDVNGNVNGNGNTGDDNGKTTQRAFSYLFPSGTHYNISQ